MELGKRWQSIMASCRLLPSTMSPSLPGPVSPSLSCVSVAAPSHVPIATPSCVPIPALSCVPTATLFCIPVPCPRCWEVPSRCAHSAQAIYCVGMGWGCGGHPAPPSTCLEPYWGSPQQSLAAGAQGRPPRPHPAGGTGLCWHGWSSHRRSAGDESWRCAKAENKKREERGSGPARVLCPPPAPPFLLCSFQWNEMVFATAPLPHAEHRPVLGELTRFIPLPRHGAASRAQRHRPSCPPPLHPTAGHGGASLVTPRRGGSILGEGTSE